MTKKTLLNGTSLIRLFILSAIYFLIVFLPPVNAAVTDSTGLTSVTGLSLTPAVSLTGQTVLTYEVGSASSMPFNTAGLCPSSDYTTYSPYVTIYVYSVDASHCGKTSFGACVTSISTNSSNYTVNGQEWATGGCGTYGTDIHYMYILFCYPSNLTVPSYPGKC